MLNGKTTLASAFKYCAAVLVYSAAAFSLCKTPAIMAQPESIQFSAAPEFSEFQLPSPGSAPTYITLGSDGALWFTEFGANQIGRITLTGTITEFKIPTAGSKPYGIAAGPDGNVWFVEYSANAESHHRERSPSLKFPPPTVSQSASPQVRNDAMWFAGLKNDRIGRIALDGKITEFPRATPGSVPYAIAAGPDGNLWFTDAGRHANDIVCMTPAGAFVEFPVRRSTANRSGSWSDPTARYGLPK